MGKQRLLLTGFEPFGGATLNPSAELVRETGWLTMPSSWELRSICLPVTFGEADRVARAAILSETPDMVISLGLAAGRAKIGLERVAINCIDAEIADNAGARPVDAKISATGPDGLFATLPLRKMLDVARAERLNCEISNTAGTYVCNFLLYRLLEDSRFSRRRCGFIHLPHLPEQAPPSGPSVGPSMSLADMQHALRILIGAALT
ncbi:MAG: hypothetical protein NDI61_10785 [Bdellovibrionaceae bacterium]|nr:hypothetical protein [Pseudobdellovibrionaceae bacterium]